MIQLKEMWFNTCNGNQIRITKDSNGKVSISTRDNSINLEDVKLAVTEAELFAVRDDDK